MYCKCTISKIELTSFYISNLILSKKQYIPYREYLLQLFWWSSVYNKLLYSFTQSFIHACMYFSYIHLPFIHSTICPSSQPTAHLHVYYPAIVQLSYHLFISTLYAPFIPYIYQSYHLPSLTICLSSTFPSIQTQPPIPYTYLSLTTFLLYPSVLSTSTRPSIQTDPSIPYIYPSYHYPSLLI